MLKFPNIALDIARPTQRVSSPAHPLNLPSPASQPAGILARFDAQARLGYLPAEALIGQLYDAYHQQLESDRQRLTVLRQKLQGHLRHLDAKFPAPTDPAPEPEKPRVRIFTAVSNDLSAKSKNHR